MREKLNTSKTKEWSSQLGDAAEFEVLALITPENNKKNQTETNSKQYSQKKRAKQ